MKFSVLIVDTDENTYKYLRSNFIKYGYIIYYVASAEEALMMLASHEIDIMICETTLPGISGFELLKKVKKTAPSIEFIFLTQYISIESVVDALRCGAYDYLLKDTEIEKAAITVKNALKKHTTNVNSKIFSEELSGIIENYLISKNAAMMKVINLVQQVADSNSTVMLYGETGTGKGVIAEILHKLSPRSKKPLIKVNCAAIPEQLLESELFGYEKGAFTGAVTAKPGRFELANGGTIFLDEIGDISPFIQVKLLSVLQEREFQRLGGIKTINVDVRVVAATNKNLVNMVKDGTFRADLYYRLNVVPIILPPLRDRKDDIEAMVNHFLLKSSESSGKEKKNISNEAFEKLLKYNWPGNIRELENTIERCVVVTPGNLITAQNLPPNILYFEPNSSITNNSKKIDEKKEILKTLEKYNGNITKAAEVLGISRRTLHRRLLKYNIKNN